DQRILDRAAERVIGAVRSAAASEAGRELDLVPGPYCRWCPRAGVCPVSAFPSERDPVDRDPSERDPAAPEALSTLD
ncbi:MAG TPA: hypothetical protein VEM77_08250, partial [Thermoplasmata archaeon]|nr:hypothetical protein [Thermoplasmata archaeon]